jgi:hypothetical protein
MSDFFLVPHQDSDGLRGIEQQKDKFFANISCSTCNQDHLISPVEQDAPILTFNGVNLHHPARVIGRVI